MTLFIRQFSAEVSKLFARKRTWMGFGAFIVLELVILLMLQTSGAQNGFRRFLEKNGVVFEEYFGGLTLAFNMLLLTCFLLGSIYVALVGGDIVAKEIEDGTLRMTLCRPVSRLRVLALKYFACLLYTFVLVAFVGVTALATGYAWRGLGGLCALVPEERFFALFDPHAGLLRYFACLPVVTLCLFSVTSLSFCFSCAQIKPAAATVLTLTVFFMDRIFRELPYFESWKHWFLSSHTITWINVFRSPVPWARMSEDFLYLLGLDATFIIIGCALFLRRDFKA